MSSGSSKSAVGSSGGSADALWCGVKESGVSLLARAAKRPSLHNIQCSSLLAGLPLTNTSVVQVSGEAGSGKSLFLMDLMARVMLPSKWQGIHINGCDAGVVFIDTDLHFNIMQLALIMESILKQKVRSVKQQFKEIKKEQLHNIQNVDTENNFQTKEKKNQFDLSQDNVKDSKSLDNDYQSTSETKSNSSSVVYNFKEASDVVNSSKRAQQSMIKNFVKKLLEKFIYFKCYHSHQFISTLLTINQVLASQQIVSLVCVDSMSAFYWYDRTYVAESWRAAESYYNKVFSGFLKHISIAGVALVAVKQSLYSSSFISNDHTNAQNIVQSRVPEQQNTYNYLGKEWHGAVKYFITLRKKLKDVDSNSERESHKEHMEMKQRYDIHVECGGNSYTSVVKYSLGGVNKV